MHTSSRTSAVVLIACCVLVQACTDSVIQPVAAPSPPGPSPTGTLPVTPTGAMAPELAADVEALVASVVAGGLSRATLDRVAAGADPRTAWVVSDLLRFSSGPDAETLAAAFTDLTGWDPRHDPTASVWVAATNQLLAWDLPAHPGYREQKAALFTGVDRRWAPFFEPDATIDWRLLSWGGVRIDDRPLGSTTLCELGCIAALDDPELVPAEDGAWYPDDGLVLGIVVGAESVALPRHQMQFHEIVNLALGGRRLGVPYCTLCNSAQAYVTDAVPGTDDPLVLRTSGLVVRSNKLMFDLTTMSAIDTFTGRAVSGPLLDDDLVLEQISVVTSTWGEWRHAHPRTRVLAQDGGIGRDYELDPLDGRDDDGPIFPVGPMDPRLPAQAQVVGGIAADGTPVAFPVADTVRALLDGVEVQSDGVVAVLDGDGLRLEDPSGGGIVSHGAFWFAWSQFHPTTVVWIPPAG